MRDLERRLPELADGIKRSPPCGSEGLAAFTPSGPGQEQALCPARRKSSASAGQGTPALRIRGQGGHRHHREGNLIVGARAFPGNPLRRPHPRRADRAGDDPDAQDVKGAPKPHTAIVDLGYRGVKCRESRSSIAGRIKSLSAKARRLLKRRQAVEPNDRAPEGRLRATAELAERIGRDVLHPVLCAAGYNLRWLMRAVARLGLKALCALASGWDAWAGGQQRGVPGRQTGPRQRQTELAPTVLLVDSSMTDEGAGGAVLGIL